MIRFKVFLNFSKGCDIFYLVSFETN